uniref:Uncharacterized protein n=1 Tax=Gadus morhua TaxID=8049 RepID=A0A8C5D3J3_GADMO
QIKNDSGTPVYVLANWTPQAMLYLKGASKLHINLTLRLTKNGSYRTVIMICLNIRITTMGQIAMADTPCEVIFKIRFEKLWKLFTTLFTWFRSSTL